MRNPYLVLLILFFSFIPASRASSNWSQQPSWANDEASTSRRSARNRDMKLNETSPFAPGSNNVSIDLGQVFLMGELTKQYRDSLGVQLHYTYGVSDLFAFDSSAGYSEHSDGQYSLITVLTGMRMNLAWYDKVVPYIIFGLGFYKPNYADASQFLAASSGRPASSPGSASAVLFGVHLGPGVDLELNRNLFFGAGLTLHNMFGTSKPLPDGTLTIGGAYTSFLLHVGATF